MPAALKKMRLQAGLTQQQLAGELGIGLSSVASYENMIRKCPPDLVERWAVACQMEIYFVVDAGEHDLLMQIGKLVRDAGYG